MSTLSQYLEREKLTQSAFADRLGVKQSFVSRLIRGEAMPSLKTAVRIAEVTGGAVPVTAWFDAPEAAE